MVREQTEVDSYAFGLLLDGAESHIEDDMDEDGFFEGDEDQHRAACDRAGEFVCWLRTNEAQILVLLSAKQPIYVEPGVAHMRAVEVL